jgi:hypothetical protein
MSTVALVGDFNIMQVKTGSRGEMEAQMVLLLTSRRFAPYHMITAASRIEAFNRILNLCFLTHFRALHLLAFYRRLEFDTHSH